MSGQYPGRGETNPRQLAEAICDLFEGRSNAFGSFTCTANQATTVVDAPNCGEDSQVFIVPRHANAAAEYGNGTIYISAVAPGAFTVTHANSATANRTFGYAIVG